jgi:hypothetical protein
VYVLEENTIFLFSCIIFYFSFFFLLNNKQQYPTAKFLFRLAMSDDDDDLCRSAPLENQIKNQLGNSLCENFGRVRIVGGSCVVFLLAPI